jgi:hypothetical protein
LSSPTAYEKTKNPKAKDNESGIGFVIVRDTQNSKFCSVPALVEKQTSRTVWIAQMPDSTNNSESWLSLRARSQPIELAKWRRVEQRDSNNSIIYLDSESLKNCDFKDAPDSKEIVPPEYKSYVGENLDFLFLNFTSPVDPESRLSLIRTFVFTRRAADQDCPRPEEQLYRGVIANSSHSAQATIATQWNIYPTVSDPVPFEINFSEFNERLVSQWTLKQDREADVISIATDFENGEPQWRSVHAADSKKFISENNIKDLFDLAVTRLQKLAD